MGDPEYAEVGDTPVGTIIQKKTNVLVMISTHGTWGTTKGKDDNEEEYPTKIKKYYDHACNIVERKIKEEKEESQLLLGYDGDGVQGESEPKELVPPTLLLLMLINKFADYNPIIIQCQNLNS